MNVSHLRRILVAFTCVAVIACGATATEGTGPTTTGVSLEDPWTGQATGAVARYDLAAHDWHATPFPTNTRLSTDGHVDVGGFPDPREGVVPELLTQYLTYAAQHLRGWSIQPTLYVQFDHPLSATSFGPPTGQPTTDKLFLADVTPQSPEYGKLIPLTTRTSGATRGVYLGANLLMAQPVWGRPLLPNTTYAFVVRRGLKDADGKPLAQPQVLGKLVRARWDKSAAVTLAPVELVWVKSLEPLFAAIDAGKLSVPPNDIAAATVFTTGNPPAELEKMADWVRTKAEVTPPFSFERADTKDPDFVLVTAHYMAPNFQQGTCPYTTPGEGGFDLAADGSPTVQRTEDIRISMVLPKQPLLIGGKVPVVESAHGTGGNWLSDVVGGKYKIASLLAQQGLAVVSIDQPMHGERCAPTTLTENALDLDTFNFLNISAGLCGFRQSALDTVFLTRLLREGRLNVPAGLGPNGGDMAFSTEAIGFIGHSQGGLSGSLAAAVEPNLRAFVLSGAGAGLSLTVVQRVNPVDFPALLTSLLALDPGELSEFHPAISLVQTLADITDPIAYARLPWVRADGVRPPDVLLTEGLLDQATPHETAEALAASLGLDILAPLVKLNPALELGTNQLLSGPVAGNLNRNGFAVTGVVTQWEQRDHFAIFTESKLAAVYPHFLMTALTGDAGEVKAP